MKNKAFTLIELLVVVLIIGILAAIAVPQYQKAVVKSQYNTLKFLVESIVQAQEIYYLTNGNYTGDFAKLDITLPGGKLDNSYSSYYYYDWGYCQLHVSGQHAHCFDNASQMSYSRKYAHADIDPNQRVCHFFIPHTTPGLKSKPQYKVCSQETGLKSPSAGTTYQQLWIYP